MKILKHIIAVTTALLVMSISSAQAGVTIPNNFTAGTPAVASQVNANFEALRSAVSGLENGTVSVSGPGGFNTAAGETGCVDTYGTNNYYYSAGSNCDAMAGIQIPDGVTVSALTCTV